MGIFAFGLLVQKVKALESANKAVVGMVIT